MNTFKIRYVIFSIIFVLTLPALVGAEEIINPFGNIQWSDNVLETIIKINNRKDVDNSKLNFRYGMSTGITENMIGLISNKDVLERISSIISEVEHQAMGMKFSKWDDDNGSKAIFALNQSDEYDGSFVLTASPILITGVPFELIAKFYPSKGYMVKYKDSVVPIRFNNVNYYLPYYLNEVVLRSKGDTSLITPEIISKIENILFDKYKNMLNNGCREKGKSKGKIICKNHFNDKQGKTNLTMGMHQGFYYEIEYKNNFTRDELDKAFEEYKATLTKEKYKNKKDATNDL